jgi:hypothetical protein
MVKSLDLSEETDIFSLSPCDSSKRMVMTKIFYCVYCETKGIKNKKYKSNNFSNHVRRKHANKINDLENGTTWKA